VVATHIFLEFSPRKLGRVNSPILTETHVLQMGWLVQLNHQPDDQSKLCQEFPEHVFLPQVGSGRCDSMFADVSTFADVFNSFSANFLLFFVFLFVCLFVCLFVWNPKKTLKNDRDVIFWYISTTTTCTSLSIFTRDPKPWSFMIQFFTMAYFSVMGWLVQPPTSSPL